MSAYKDAFDLAIGQLKDVDFAERIASIATLWKPDNKNIYTQMHGALKRAGLHEKAK